jgi:hypothetical protein
MSQEGIQPLTSMVTSQGITIQPQLHMITNIVITKKYKHIHFEFQTL